MLDRVTHRSQSAQFEAGRKQPVLTRPAFGARPVETNGWDVVSAVRIAEINEAIENAGTSPTEFSQTLGSKSVVKGSFVPWRVGPDGDGTLINLDIGLRDVEIDRGGVVTTLGEAMAIVRVHLEMMPTGKKALFGSAPTQELALVIKTDVDSALLRADPDAKAATLMEIDGSEHLPIKVRVDLNLALETWLNDNIHLFHHVFATVNVVKMASEEVKKKAFSWMMPSEVGYAFSRNATAPENSVLAILCQTGGRKADGLTLQAQADMIPQGSNAAFVVSKRRLIRDMILPGIVGAFDGLEKTHLRIRKNDSGLALNDPVQLREIKDDEGRTFDPVLHKLDVLVRDTEIALLSRTKTLVSPGIWSVCTADASYTFGLTTNTKGEKTIGYAGPEPHTTEEVERDKAVDILDWILKALGFIAVVVLGFATAGIAWYAAAVAVVCLAGELSIDYIERTRKNDGPPIDLLVTNATTAVSWSTGARFDPVFAALNGGLQIGGILGATKTQSLIDTHRQFQAPFQTLMATRVAA
jgi:hypothetical protein